MRFALLAAVLLTSAAAWGRANDLPATASRITALVATAPEGRAHAWTGRLTSIDGGVTNTGKRLSRIDFSADGDDWSLDYLWNPAQPGDLNDDPWLQVTADLDGPAPEVTEYWLDDAERLSRVIYPDLDSGRRQHDYTWRADGMRTEELITRPDDGDDACGPNGECAPDEECVSDVCKGTEEKIVHLPDDLGQLATIQHSYRIRGGNWDESPPTAVETDRWGRILEYQTAGIVRQMAWDVEGRMLSLDNGPDDYTYRYNWRDQRVSRTGPDGTVASAWEADGLLAEAFDDGQGAPSPDVVRTHLRGAGMVLGVDGAAFGLDHLGSPVLRWDGADATIQRFDAWGAHRGGATPAFGEESVGYTSHAFDAESKLTYAQARYYDPTIGAFLSPDPWSGSLEMPGTLQKYAYALGNPLEYTDPDGRVPWSDIVFGYHALKRALDPCTPKQVGSETTGLPGMGLPGVPPSQRTIFIRPHAFREPGGVKSVFLHELAHHNLPYGTAESVVDAMAVKLATKFFGHHRDIKLPFVD